MSTRVIIVGRAKVRKFAMFSIVLPIFVLASCSASQAPEVAAGCNESVLRSELSQELGGKTTVGYSKVAVIESESKFGTTPVLLWKSDEGSDFSKVYIEGDDLYVTFREPTDGRRLHVFEWGSGNRLWELPVAEDGPPPAVSGLRLFPVSDSGHLHALSIERESGVSQLPQLWSSDIVPRFGPVQADANSVYLLAGNIRRGPNEVIDLNIENGATLWKYEMPVRNQIPETSFDGEFSLGEGRLVFGSFGGHVYSLSTQTGNLCWETKIDGYGNVFQAPTITTSSVLLVKDSTAYALDLQTGETLWNHEDASSFTSVAVSPEGVAIFGTDDGSLRAVGVRSGDTNWTLEVGNFLHTKPIVAVGVVYSITDDGILYAVDAVVGRILWTLPVGESFASPVWMNGYLFVVAGGRVQAFFLT